MIIILRIFLILGITLPSFSVYGIQTGHSNNSDLYDGSGMPEYSDGYEDNIDNAELPDEMIEHLGSFFRLHDIARIEIASPAYVKAV